TRARASRSTPARSACATAGRGRRRRAASSAVKPAKAAAPAGNLYGKSLGLALTGAVVGCLGVGIVSGVMGVWPLFFAFPPFTVHLVLSALVGAAATAMLARLWRRPLSTVAIMAVSAVLTFLFFAALPLYFFLYGSSREAGLLFN